MEKNIKLKFSDDFKNIVVEAEINDNNVEEYIIKHVSSIVFVCNGNHYCPLCLRKIDNLYCNNCDVHYNKNCYVVVDIKNIRDIHTYSHIYFNYLVFSTYLNHVYIKVYNVVLTYLKDRKIDINVKNIFEVNQYGVYSTNEDKLYLYKDLEKFYDGDMDYFDTFDFYHDFNNTYLYVDNLEILKETSIYKYSFMWILKDYLKDKIVSLEDITYIPIISKEFEYLIKLKLYNLAFSNSIRFNGNFENTFGVDKSYYDFMRDNDINITQLNMLKLIKVKDIELLKIMAKDDIFFQELSDEVSLYDLNNYMDFKTTDKEVLHRYFAYLKNIKSLGFDTKDKSVLFPINFELADEEAYRKRLVIEDKDIDIKIRNRSEGLSRYIIDDYIIYPPSSLEDFIEEGKMMHNCVRDYVISYINGESDIYFMRKKEEKDKSLVTIEIKDNKINQAYAHYNMDVPDELKSILDKFLNEIKQK